MQKYMPLLNKIIQALDGFHIYRFDPKKIQQIGNSFEYLLKEKSYSIFTLQ